MYDFQYFQWEICFSSGNFCFPQGYNFLKGKNITCIQLQSIMCVMKICYGILVIKWSMNAAKQNISVYCKSICHSVPIRILKVITLRSFIFKVSIDIFYYILLVKLSMSVISRNYRYLADKTFFILSLLKSFTPMRFKFQRELYFFLNWLQKNKVTSLLTIFEEYFVLDDHL